jgi:hypothetical protein
MKLTNKKNNIYKIDFIYSVLLSLKNYINILHALDENRK